LWRVRIIVPFPPGGSVGFIARIVAQFLTEQMGQQFIVENRVGANGTIGSDTVAKAPPDGHTLLVQASTPVTGPLLVSNVPYDAVKDFTAISEIGSVPLIMTVHPSVEAKNLKEFIEQQPADPKKYIFGTSPVGCAGYFATEAIKHEAKLEGMLVVPYKGTSAAIADLLAGQVHALIDAIPSSYPARQGRQAQAPRRHQRGAPPDDARRAHRRRIWPTRLRDGILVRPLGPRQDAPRELSTRIASEVNKAVRSKLANERLTAQGFKPVGSTPDQYSAYIDKEIKRHAAIARDAKIKVQQ
jgi:tripartite-type tricarboxylate transporter receptor subunit TctC